jgi:uncharacterized protein Veg
VHLSEILIDNRILCGFVDAEGADNVIFCRPLEESLDNVATITTKDNEFIHNFITESTGDNFLVTSVKLSDGEIFDNVKFKLVVCENGDLPHSTIDTSAFELPSDFDENKTKPELIHEDIQIVEPVLETVSYPEYTRGSFDPIIIEQTKALQEQLSKQQVELQQKEDILRRRQATVELNEKLQKTLENYKSELLTEYYNTHEKQKDILSSQLQDVSTSLFKYLGEKIKDQKTDSIELLNNLSESNLKQLRDEQDQSIKQIQSSINNLLEEKISTNSDNVNKLLVERSGELQDLFSEKIVVELEEHKKQIEEEIESINFTIDGLVEEKLKLITEETDKNLISRAGELQIKFSDKLTSYKTELFEEFKTLSNTTASTLFTEKLEEFNTALNLVLEEHKQKLNETLTNKINEVGVSINNYKTEIDGKLPKLDKTIDDINNRINTLVNEKRNIQTLVDSARQYTDTKVAKVSEEVMAYARRILDLGSGSGSVAVQYANGGTMNGTLNITNGSILSGGIDLATIFSQGGGGGSQTLSFNSNTAALSISNGNTVSLSALSATGSAGNPNVNNLVISNSANWNNSYTTLTANSANWNTAYNISTAYQTASGSFLTSIPQSLSGNWQNTYTTVLTNSANWNTAYNISTAYQSASGTFATNTTLNSVSSQLVLNSAINTLTGNWNSSYTNLTANSANWNSAYTLVRANSASWNNPLSSYSFVTNGSTSIFNLSTTAPFTNAAGYIVSMNGAIQTPNTDFTITYSGTNYLNLNFTPRAGALIDVQTLGNGVITNSSVVTVSSSTYNPLYAYVNSNFNVNAPTGNYMVDTTTSGVTATLPTTPTIGTVIGFMDPYYTWATNNFTLSASVNIENQSEPVAMNVAGFSLRAIYVGGTYGWRLVQ